MEVCMKKVSGAFVLLLVIVSCSSPIIRSGQAELEFSLGGVLPAISDEDVQFVRATRAITPNSINLRATIKAEGYNKTFTLPIVAATALVSGLPAYKPLTITLEALDYYGEVTTSWTGTVTLKTGKNSVPAVLKPVGTIETFQVGAGGVTIPFGKAHYYRFVHDNFNMTWFTKMLYAQTTNNESVWMGVYNENWEPLATIVESRGDGWAVFDFTGDETVVYIALAYIRNPAFPPQAQGIQVDLVIKDAYFVTSAATTGGTGTSTNPFNPQQFVTNIQSQYAAFILSEGTYSTPIQLNNEVWLFGGFDPTNWKKRIPESTRLVSNSAEPAVTISGSSLKLIDGVTIQTNWLGDTQSPYAYALKAGSSAYALIKNCVLQGPSGTAFNDLNAGAFILKEGEAVITLLQTKIHGGTITTDSSTVSLTGIKLEAGSSIKLINCSIDGGTITSNQGVGHTSALDGSQGEVYVVGSLLWGGVCRAQTSAQSDGIYVSAVNSLNVSVFSSVISAGYVQCSAGKAKGAALTITGLTNGSLTMYGSVLDGGSIESSDSSSYSTGLISESLSQDNIKLYGNIVVSSTPGTVAGKRVPIMYKFYIPTVNNCVFAGFSNDAYNTYTKQFIHITSAENLLRVGGSMHDFFQSYIPPYAFSTFLANTWRPAGSIAGLTSTQVPEDWGINGDLLGTFPNLLVDLGGKLRPRTDFWTIGPYQK